MLPDDALYVPAITLKSVDLPAPFEPIIVIKSPLFTVNDKFFKTCFSSGVPSKVCFLHQIYSLRIF